MNGWTIAAALVLFSGVTVVWLCVVGLLRGRDAFDRLHFPGPAALFGPLAIAVAFSITQAQGTAVLRAWLIAALLIPTSGVLAHATARAEFLRLEGTSDFALEDTEVDHEMA
jgi:monovalent cation/proton antiporter MnhG/PhaG subunit